VVKFAAGFVAGVVALFLASAWQVAGAIVKGRQS
jgi:hypothetical protein